MSIETQCVALEAMAPSKGEKQTESKPVTFDAAQDGSGRPKPQPQAPCKFRTCPENPNARALGIKISSFWKWKSFRGWRSKRKIFLAERSQREIDHNGKGPGGKGIPKGKDPKGKDPNKEKARNGGSKRKKRFRQRRVDGRGDSWA